MRRLFFTVLVAILISFSSGAAIFRIGYPGTAVSGVDYAYTNISAAMTAASAGDTIQLYQQYWPSSTSVTVTKPLKFIGFGWNLDKNLNLQAIQNSDQNSIGFTFNSGSSGSVVTGVYAYQTFINTNNISIYRSRFGHYCYLGGGVSNVNIGDCIFSNGYAIIENGVLGATNLHIFNTFFSGNPSLGSSSGLFNNNIVTSSWSIYSFIVKNCIFTNGGCYSPLSSVFQYNLFAGTCSSTISGTGNQFGINMSNVFANWNSGNIQVDTQLILKTSSPAIGAGLRNDSTTTDAGIFGGELGETFKISGIPSVPAIYQLSAPSQSATTNPFNITLSVRSNN